MTAQPPQHAAGHERCGCRLGHVSVIDPDDSETLDRLRLPDYRAKVERGFLIRAAAMDWNCPQHIRHAMQHLHDRIAALETELHKTGLTVPPEG